MDEVAAEVTGYSYIDVIAFLAWLAWRRSAAEPIVGTAVDGCTSG